ncbi:tRNA (adenosine(37)-N6)-threonylcarbamoyltransferase complex dimerization subunit type 1 TsaB [Shimazuella sp. AN120528]|uniref:tRNA (adenosine(37)-N6)-threonylcarbamoyltransferase complex dimerization subunit type 1 TsaB n=1 Tax=Shimazuella soli TaxID=1892854 RepID=UPI001F0E8FEE|nr:tRNA (adenosine(37)-N6)-threonylcarbamoyltransferase complex dimerization subunit type 1 TsaB [Shimazuella soli]MCH5585395.1 tRNA (adenosine(37)-N6)-threonylcarbamoyltransferase complex dimerization subunit type 1 TsaB [Shimazuella soli]
MNILAVDTSTLVLSIAVLNEQKILGEKTTNLKKNHSVRLMPAISELLTDLDMTLSDMDLFAVTAGPGSYTGVRIGVTTIKTFAWALHKPFLAVSTLEVIAMNGLHFPGNIVPLIDARREQAYTAVYQGQEDRLQLKLPEQIILVDDLLEQLKQDQNETLFIGDDVTMFSDKITSALKERAIMAPTSHNLPRASNLGILSLQKWLETGKGERHDFSPNYLQLTLAEKNLLGRLT